MPLNECLKGRIDELGCRLQQLDDTDQTKALWAELIAYIETLAPQDKREAVDRLLAPLAAAKGELTVEKAA